MTWVYFFPTPNNFFQIFLGQGISDFNYIDGMYACYHEAEQVFHSLTNVIALISLPMNPSKVFSLYIYRCVKSSRVFLNHLLMTYGSLCL